MERREHRAERASMQRLLTPGRLVVYGPGDRVQDLVTRCVRGGFGGEMVAVSTDGVRDAAVPTAADLGRGRRSARPGRGVGADRANSAGW